jgi:Uma2 family endonuclease
MKGVFNEVPNFILEWRRETGADRFDEMWEGVLHMNPPPDDELQELEWSLETWLRFNWRTPDRKVYHQFGVSPDEKWTDNYRVPDLVLITADRVHLHKGTHFQGGPAVVVEIRSPGDETFKKFDFYASLDISEIWVIDRSTKEPQLFRLVGETYKQQAAEETGWILSQAVGIELRHESGNRLGIRLAGDEASFAQLPE